MSSAHFDSTQDPELRAKLDEAKRRLELADFLTTRPKPRECLGSPEHPECPKFPVSLVHPMSNGQDPRKDLLAGKDLEGLAALNACTARNTARPQRFQLLRDLKAVELRWGVLDTAELMLTFDEWYRLSEPFLDSQKTRDDYLAAFLAEFGKVRVPTVEGQTITEALASVSRLSLSRLPTIPGMADAAESWRRIAALHRELARRSATGIYFLTCRDAAKAFPGLSHQAAYNINLALAQLGVVRLSTRATRVQTAERPHSFSISRRRRRTPRTMPRNKTLKFRDGVPAPATRAEGLGKRGGDTETVRAHFHR